MKEYIVCYTLENDIKHERIIKAKDVNREEVIQEVFEKILVQNYFKAKCDEGEYWINSSSIRYLRVL